MLAFRYVIAFSLVLAFRHENDTAIYLRVYASDRRAVKMTSQSVIPFTQAKPRNVTTRLSISANKKQRIAAEWDAPNSHAVAIRPTKKNGVSDESEHFDVPMSWEEKHTPLQVQFIGFHSQSERICVLFCLNAETRAFREFCIPRESFCVLLGCFC